MKLLDTVKASISQCGCDLDLDQSIMEVLKSPMRVLLVSLPVRMDNGRVKIFQGCRVQYNDVLGPTKGGIRYHPDETLQSIKALAALMTWKCSLHGLPLGGAKGGIICNPKELSSGEQERLSRAYIRGFYHFIGPRKDILAPDVGTDSQIMAWMVDEYSRLAGEHVFGAATGKPVILEGSALREESTALGGWFAIQEVSKEIGLDLNESRAAIQGFGNVGNNAAKLASLFGCDVIAISDSRGGIYKEDGLNIPAVLKHKIKNGSVVGFPGSRTISNQDLLELELDILIPAALEGAISEENGKKIKAQIIAEFANGPTTAEADKILSERGIQLIPDILCNGGGVIVSYFEMIQNFEMQQWDRLDVQRRLNEKMVNAYRSVSQLSRDYGVTMRQAAYIAAIKRLVEALKVKGLA